MKMKDTDTDANSFFITNLSLGTEGIKPPGRNKKSLPNFSFKHMFKTTEMRPITTIIKSLLYLLRAARNCDAQVASPIFTKLPLELRQMIW